MKSFIINTCGKVKLDIIMKMNKIRLSVVSKSELNQNPNVNNKFSEKIVDNTLIIGKVLYTEYFLLFQISGIILLVAMIGSILLTLRKREGVKKQSIHKQTLKK